jgi:glycosyltransferase involved in cell wall biosynthesis
LVADEVLRERIGARAREVLATGHAPRVVAERYQQAIERFHRSGHSGAMYSLMDTILNADHDHSLRANDLNAMAWALSRNHPPAIRKRTIFVDVSVTANDDLKTGIERVVRSVTLELLRGATAADWRVEPVRASGGTYVYAHVYTCQLLGIAPTGIPDQPVDIAAGDIFLGLDLAQTALPETVAELERFRLAGVSCHFVMYDMLPLLHPRFFPDWLEEIFRRWLETACRVADGLWCISDAVATDVCGILDKLPVARRRPLLVGSFPLGSDIASSAPSAGVPDDDKRRIESLPAMPLFLMVGTVEPRKGHLQMLDAFEALWRDGVDAQLVVVGKLGWMMETFDERVARLTSAGEHRIHWFGRASDELLAALYKRADALVAASFGEGYGLPLIEAAAHGLPVLARDIPVFREVGGDSAYYFDAIDGAALAGAIRRWLELHAAGQAPSSGGIGGKTWKISAEQLVQNILEGRYTRVWTPPTPAAS